MSDPHDTDARDEAVMGRLRAASPAAGLGVDFADVAAEVDRLRRSRRRWGTGLSAAAVVAAVAAGGQLASRGPFGPTIPAGAGVVVATSGGSLEVAQSASPAPELTPGRIVDASADCPWANTRLPGALPPEGFDPASALVPTTVPIDVVICSYPEAPGPARVGVRLQGRLDPLVRDLRSVRPAGAPQPCPTPVSATRELLVRLGYAGERAVWLSASTDDCAGGTTNGTFTTDATLARAFAGAAGQGSWWGLADFSGGVFLPGDPAVLGEGWGRCATRTTGQRGTELSFAPGDVNRLTVCRRTLDGRVEGERVASAAAAGRIVAALEALPAQTLVGCARRTPLGPRYAVLLSYSAGPDQLVQLDPQCGPLVTSDRLEALDESGSVLAAIRAATGW